MTSEIRQRKLNEQRQKIKENQYKKSIQQLKSIQMNDNDNKITLKYSYKDEYSPLIKSKSNENENSSIFAYNGPELFKFSSSISRSENVVEKYSYTDIPDDVLKIDNFSKKCKKESIQKSGFNYSNMNSCGNDNDIDKDEDLVKDVTECKEELRKIEQNQPNFVNRDDSNDPSALDDDRDDTNLSSIERIPSVHGDNQPGKIESSEENKAEDNMLQSLPESLLNSHMEIENFVTKPAPEQYIVKCRITRDKRGVDKGMFPTYYLHLERQNHKPLFLLAARRRKLSKTSNYLISCDATDMKRSGFGYLAKLRSNFIGTHFTLYDNGQNPDSPNSSKKPFRKELCAVIYETNVLGFKGPRKMTVIIPGMRSDKTPIIFEPKSNDGDLLECCRARKMDNLLELHNKKPVWNEDSQSYVLNFQGRVTQASVKNFQIINDNDADYIIMQFGRTSDNSFSMDYAYPMSAVQAFGLALSSFDGKIACE